jgi:hypothetical protein
MIATEKCREYTGDRKIGGEKGKWQKGKSRREGNANHR